MSLTQIVQSFDGHKLTIIGNMKKQYIKGKEVAELLGYMKSRRAIETHVEEEDKITFQELSKNIFGPPSGGAEKLFDKKNIDPQTIFLTRDGLMSLVFSTKNKQIKDPELVLKVKTFKKWVGCVIDSIIETGQYTLPHIKPVEPLSLDLRTERELQMKVVDFLTAYEESHCIMFNPSLGESTYIHAKDMGYHKGTFDIIMTNRAIKQYDKKTPTYWDGLALELKSPNGYNQLSVDQKQMYVKYTKQNFKVIVSNNYEEIVEELSQYISQVLIPCPICDKKYTRDVMKTHLEYVHRGPKQKIKLMLKHPISIL